MTLGILATDAREARGWNRNQAARLMGVTHQTLSNVEAGGPRPPGRNTRESIERVYGWRRGCIQELWDNHEGLEFGSITAGFVSPGRLRPATPTAPAVLTLTPVAKAADLTTAELMAELSFRILIMDQDDRTA